MLAMIILRVILKNAVLVVNDVFRSQTRQLDVVEAKESQVSYDETHLGSDGLDESD